jgi:hypothetical protein
VTDLQKNAGPHSMSTLLDANLFRRSTMLESLNPSSLVLLRASVAP